MRVLLRVLFVVSGSVASTFLVALLEMLSVVRVLAAGGGAATASEKIDFVFVDTGVLAPAAIGVGVGVGIFALVLEPEGDPSLLEDIARVRSLPSTRTRAAALAPLVVLLTFVATVCAAHVSRAAAGHGAPAASGLTMAIASVAMTIVSLAAALAVLPNIWRILARRAALAKRMNDPVFTGAVAIGAVTVLLGLGIATGDPGGAGGIPGVGIFAVLARPELDLRPVVYLVVIAGMGFLSGKLIHVRARRLTAMIGPFIILSVITLCARASSSLDRSHEVNDLLEKAPLGKVSLSLLRRLTDRDHDGYSPHYGGGDCNDRDPRINPTAIDIPNNGIDEDCSGDDAKGDEPIEDRAATPGEPAASAAPVGADGGAPAGPRRTFNVVLFTVDTLRADLGFAGYPRPVTPNIDKLVARGVAFERAYSTASYTAKAMGSMMIGKYASETNRNWDHYTTYYPSNTFIAQRAHAANAYTIAGHCHYYFQWNTGYHAGFDVFDTSAIAPRMADNDSSTTSDLMSNLAIKLLGRPELRSLGEKRFYAWFHYFDPHAQYVHHEGAPDFAAMQGGPPSRAVYDDEVWFTDKHIGRVLDFIATQPWAPNTAVIITADHGEAFGDAHGVKTHGHEIWESLVRVPLVLYVPGATPKRVKVKRSHIDIAPTILDLLGGHLPTKNDLRGESLLKDLATDIPEERDVYLDMPEGPYNDVRRALITGPSPGMKLIHFGAKRFQLFDLATDPAENTDLFGDKERLNPVMERMEKFRARMREIAVVNPRVGN